VSTSAGLVVSEISRMDHFETTSRGPQNPRELITVFPSVRIVAAMLWCTRIEQRQSTPRR
jgi:hypothetical protein